jgi:4-phosphopantoate--beta-alanine ligase
MLKKSAQERSLLAKPDLPKDHPRRESLAIRHRLTGGFGRGLVAEAGLIAHGRGEAFDYLLGEKTVSEAKKSADAAAALLLLAKKPVISVNGNAAALAPREIVKLAKAVGAEIEVNLFYRTAKRERLIAQHLRQAGAEKVYGLRKKHKIPGLSSARADVDDALWRADVVLVSLEDGDRTEALKKADKKVIAIDLNPLSRTARKADVTIVDNIVRAFPNLVSAARRLRRKKPNELGVIAKKFSNSKNLKRMEELIRYVR